MRKLGLIGGMSWVSTESYYAHINRMVQARTSKMCSAPLLMESLNFCDLSRLSSAEEWKNASRILTESAKRLERIGATAIIIGANSMHKVYDQVAAKVKIPIIHIADTVGDKMVADGVANAALIGTRNVMTESFYRQRLVSRGIKLMPPKLDTVEDVDGIIYDELMVGKVTRDAERKMKTLLTNLEKDGAEAVVLGCTELEMIVDVDANVLPIYDSTRIHAAAAVEWILGGD